MPIEIPDLEGVESWKAANLPIPLGKHLCEIVSLEEKPAATGSPQVIIEWRVVSGPYADRASREWLVVLPQTLGKVKAFLEALNWPLQAGNFTMPTQALVGRRAVITVSEREYGGKMRTEIIAHELASTPIASMPAEIPIDTAGLGPVAPDPDDLPF